MDFDVTTMEGVQRPIGFFDPFGLSKTSPQARVFRRHFFRLLSLSRPL